jgi:hypothetical protein
MQELKREQYARIPLQGQGGARFIVAHPGGDTVVLFTA